jgi:octaprenyl-diphosphate synthase
VDLTDLYPRLGDLLARVEVKTERVWAQEPGFLADAARDLLSGRGKRLRPTLLLLAAECAGGATDSSIAIASMVEVVHAASLVHDDVIDDAPSRRGRRSAKVVWGNKVSVLLGDYLIARAFSLLEREDSHCLIGPLCDVAARMCGGQVGELRAAGRRGTEPQYLEIVRDKTASLFGFCGQAGVQTAQGPPALARALGLFGESFGVAFQVADDILDLVGSNGRSGKPEGRDLAERKWTLPLIRAYERGTEEERARLGELLGADQVSAREVELVREMARAAGAIDYAWHRVEDWLRKAREQLALVPDSGAKQALLVLAGERFPLPVMT